MMKRLLLAFCVPIGIQGCAIGDPVYPANWDPLVPSASVDCQRLEGTYADRGQTRDRLSARSFTRELFGYREEWKAATHVQLRFLSEEVLQVTIWAGDSKVSERNLHAATGDFSCEAGRLLVHDKRWVAEDLVAGHENVVIELHDQGTHVVALVKEFTFALAFVVVPFIADATHWYRFQRESVKTRQ
jgi:hypothetical protein